MYKRQGYQVALLIVALPHVFLKQERVIRLCVSPSNYLYIQWLQTAKDTSSRSASFECWGLDINCPNYKQSHFLLYFMQILSIVCTQKEYLSLRKTVLYVCIKKNTSTMKFITYVNSVYKEPLKSVY